MGPGLRPVGFFGLVFSGLGSALPRPLRGLRQQLLGGVCGPAAFFSFLGLRTRPFILLLLCFLVGSFWAWLFGAFRLSPATAVAAPSSWVLRWLAALEPLWSSRGFCSLVTKLDASCPTFGEYLWSPSWRFPAEHEAQTTASSGARVTLLLRVGSLGVGPASLPCRVPTGSVEIDTLAAFVDSSTKKDLTYSPASSP